jgi:hypothetical protein
LLPYNMLASSYENFTWKAYALGFSYEGFTFIKDCMS